MFVVALRGKIRLGGIAFVRGSMSSGQYNDEELDEQARQGETVVPGGAGGKSLEAQERLAEGD